MQWIAPHLEPLLAIVAATVDQTGCLIEANRGFLRLIAADASQAKGLQVARFFIQPDFATLLNKPAGINNKIHTGLLTVGEYMGRTRSLRGRVWRQGNLLQILAEFDIEELEALCATTLDLNRDYANAQLELAQSNHQLKQSEAQLQRLVRELTNANTKRQQAQDQLLQAERLASIGFLAAGVAHEINNPLGYVNSNLHTLADYTNALLRIVEAYEQAALTADIPSEPFARVIALQSELDLDFIKDDVGPMLSESKEGIAKVKQIVQALKDFSGVDAMSASKEADIGQAIETTMSLLANQLRHCDVRNELGELPHVACVPAELRRVFMSLLLNAAQAIETQGVVSIRGGCEGDEVWVEIADSGKGIPPDVLPHIFDPFFTTKPLGKGAGLGLSIAHGLVKLHRGRIEVASELGHGARFTVYLPVLRA